MKILVDELPAKPAECPFVTWNCEYGYMCRLKRGALRNRETIFCKDTAHCPWLQIPADPAEEEGET